MRPLTPDEKSRSEAVRKQANKLLQEQRKSMGVRMRNVSSASILKAQLIREFDMLCDVKGLPAIISLDGEQVTINYEMFTRFMKKLKNRHVILKLDRSSGSPVLTISHSAGFYSKVFGKVELYELPHYQQELLSDLPIIEID